MENSSCFFPSHILSFLLTLWIKGWHYRSISFFLIHPRFSKIFCNNHVLFLIIKTELGFLTFRSLCWPSSLRPGHSIHFSPPSSMHLLYLVPCKLLIRFFFFSICTAEASTNKFLKAFLLCMHFPIIFHFCVYPATHICIFRLSSWETGNVFACSTLFIVHQM